MYAASRIEQYLRDHPDGDLLIAVGYAAAAGMAWLAQRTAGRRVSLLIGDTRSQYWQNVSEPDRATCLAFMHRPDVEIRNWYRTKRSRSGESAAHLKVWAMHDNWSPMSALVGSGNLTRQGLDNNVEVMVEAHGSDMRQAWDTAQDLWGKAWPCADRLTEYLGGPEPPAPPPRSRATASARRPATATPRHATRADHTRRPPPPPSPQATPHHARAPSLDGSLCQGSPQAGKAASSESSGCASLPGSSSSGQRGPRSLWRKQAKNPMRILAVVGLVAAIGNGVALALALRALRFSEFFSSWELPVFFVCCSLALGGMCYWVSTRAEGTDKVLAIAGVAVSAIPLVVGLVVLALLALLILLAIFILGGTGSGPRRSSHGRSRSGRRRSRR